MNDEPAILLKPQFLGQPSDMFSFLLRTVRWDDRMRARKTASFGVAYDYSQIAYAPTAMPEALQKVCAQLQEELNFFPNNCLLNYYENGDDSMGFHSDSSEALEPGTGVAIVSLGSVRSIVFRNKRDRSVEHAYPLPSGSLLYMTEDLQGDWLHAIPKASGVGERISLTFRAIVK
jgi:alkylated DNA repair dioxygenase AlkB